MLLTTWWQQTPGIQVLRRPSGPLTADAIARELEKGKPTVYRAIAALVVQRVRSAARLA